MTQRIARLALGAVAGAALIVAPAGCAVANVGKVNPPALWYKIAGEITEADAIAAADRYRTVILQSWQTAAATTIKTRNPLVTVLAYKDLSSASWAEAALYNERNGLPMATGVGYLDATANGWLAKDTLGNPVVWKGYPNLWQMEVWNPAYQQRWVDNVTREMKTSVFDGVFGDDALTTLKYYSSATLAEAPTDADLQAGEEALISKASTALHALGKKLVVNISGATDNLAVWTRWSQMTDGAMLEHFMHWGSDPNSPSNYLYDWGSRGWTAGVAAMATSPGNVAVTTSADTDDRSYRYGLASFLIGTGGHGAFTAVDSYKKAPFRPEQSWDLGYATAPMVKTGVAYSRVFPNGFAVVNPSKDTTATVTLPAPLVNAAGATVTSVTLPPLNGAVFKGTTTTSEPSTMLRTRKPKPLGTSAYTGATKIGRPVTGRQLHTTSRPARAARPAQPTRLLPDLDATLKASAVRAAGRRQVVAHATVARATVAHATIWRGHATESAVRSSVHSSARSVARSLAHPAAHSSARRGAAPFRLGAVALLLALASGAWLSRRRLVTGSTSRSS